MRERDLIQAAWREFQAAKAIAGTVSGVHDQPRPPGWFVREECGFSFDHGPSLMWTCLTLERFNRAACKQLGSDAPLKTTWPRRHRVGRVPLPSRKELIEDLLVRLRTQWFGGRDG